MLIRHLVKPSKKYLVLLDIHSSFTKSFFKGKIRFISEPYTWIFILLPNESYISILFIISNSHGLFLKAYCWSVNAPILFFFLIIFTFYLLNKHKIIYFNIIFIYFFFLFFIKFLISKASFEIRNLFIVSICLYFK